MRPADDGKKGNVIPLPRPSPEPVPRRSLTPYLAIAAVLIATVGIGFIGYQAIRSRSDLNRGLVALNESYQERPVEVRLSDLKYAPMPSQRGEAPRGDYVKRELAGSRLRTAVTENPSAASLRALGQWYLTERQFDEAIDHFNKALALNPNDAKSHINLGAALLEKGKLDIGRTEGGRSVENFSRSLEQLNKGLQLDSSLLEGYFNRALVYEYMMLPREAETAWREYLQKDSNSQWAEEAKRNLKQLEESNNRKAMTVDDTLKEFRQARQARDDDAAWKLVTQHYTSAGNELSNRLLDSFLDLSPADTSESSLSDLSYLADLEQKQTGDRYTSSLVQRYSRATPAVRNRIANARRRANTAYALFTHSKFDESIKEYTAAKQEYEDAGDLVGRTFILYRLAHCEVLRGKLARAKQSFQQLLPICEANGYHWLVGQCLYSLAHAYSDNNEFTTAIDYSSRGLDKFKQFQDLNGEVKALTQLAAISQFFYRERNALDYLSQGLALTTERQVEPMQQWGFFVQAGLSVSAMKLYDAALLFQKRALEIALEMGRPMMVQRSRGELGFAYAALKMYAEALAEATKAFEVGSSLPDGRELMANASWQLGDILRESGQCDKAIDAYNRSIDLYEDLNFELYDYVAHKGRLLCLARTGDNNAIGNELTKVLELFEEFRSKITTESQRNSFFAVEQSVYDLAIDYEYQRKRDPIKAFEYSEVSRARTLLDAVSGSTSVRRTSYGLDLEISTRNRPLNLTEIQTQMPDSAQILQYAVLDNKLFIWVITKSAIKPEVIDITGPALTDKVRGYLTNINQPPGGANANTSAAAEMFRLLVAPAEPYLDKNKFLCIVPDKILHYLPFDALVSPATGAYLVEDYNTGVAPSSSVFVRFTKAAALKTLKADETFLGVGNPRFDRASFDSLNDLKAAVQEVETISTFYPQSRPLLVGPRATEDNITSEIPKADVVHLAMHFIQNGKSEMLSGFPLSPTSPATGPATDRGSDGFWQSAEIYSLKLPRTRLALLSACQTGIEQHYDAEGAVGAARPFLVAGVPVVVASLWPVDSDATAALMIDLHKHRTRYERPVAQALRQAKLDMLHGQDLRYRHPYYWAPFVVVGGLSTF